MRQLLSLEMRKGLYENERYPGCESNLPRLRKQNLPWWRRAGSNSSSELNELVKNDPQVNEVLAMVLGLRGLIRTRMLGTDAVIIAPRDLRDYLPVAGDLTTGMFVSHYQMKHLQKLGLIKLKVIS